MGLGPLFKSVGKAALEELPEGLKPQSVVPALKKKGVTDEELSFAGLATAENFAKVEQQFDTNVISGRTNTLYDWVNVEGGKGNPTYKERIVTFGNEGRFTSEHFPEGPSNYLMHNRSQDVYGPNGKERQLLEIQSDLHQIGRQEGYSTGLDLEKARKAQEIDALTSAFDNLEISVSELESRARTLGWDDTVEVNFWLNNEYSSLSSNAPPASPWQKTWVKKGIELELADAVEKGLDTIAVPISGDVVKGLERAPGVQTWYETTVVDTMKKIAKQQGATFSYEGGTARIVMPKNRRPSFTLFAAAPATVMGVLAAKQQGYSQQEIDSYIANQGGDLDEVNEQVAKAEAAKAEGYSDQEILEFLNQAPTTVEAVESQHLTPAYNREDLDPKDPKEGAFLDLTDESKDLNLKELVARMQVVHPNMSSVTTRTAAFFGNEKAARIAEEALVSQAKRITQSAKDVFGIDLMWDQQDEAWFVQGAEGPVRIEPSVLDSIAAEGVEITGASIGGVLGAVYGKKLGTVGALIGSVGGAIAGSMLGTEADYMIEAMNMQVDLSAEVAAHKALTAAEASVIGDVVGFGVVKSVGTAWKGIKRAKDFMLDGNSQGAFQAVKEVMFVTDDEANEIVARLQTLVPEIPGKTQAQKAIAAVATTQIGGDFLVKASGHIDPLAGRAATKAIDDRAKDLLRTAESLTDENVGRILTEDLVNYTADVKNFYQAVKTEAANAPLGEEFTFNFNKLAINPILEKLGNNITDPAVLEKFLLQAKKIRNMSDSRSFTDLLELRQLVNDFKFNKRISKTKDFQALNDVLTKIDQGIEVGAHAVMPGQADEWLVNWASARAQYAKMKTVEDNVLFKALSRPGISEQDTVSKLTKYINSIDGTFAEVMEKLPKATRHKAEGAIVNSLTEKFTAGVGEGTRAVHFPMLDDALRTVSFTSPEARQYKAAVHKFAEVFKNDVALAQVSGQIQIPKFQSYLTADPVVRLKFEIASGVFNTLKTYVPGKSQRNMALVNNLATLLETPLNSKAARDVMAEVADDVDIAPQVVRLQQEVANAAMIQRDKTSQAIKLYGEGAVKNMEGAGQALEIPGGRIATQATAKTVAEADGILQSDVKALDFALKQRGYAGLMTGSNKVRVL